MFIFYSVPGEPPRNVRGQNDSSTSILVEWDPPREEVLYGILRGFRIRYGVAIDTDITNTTELIPEQQSSYIIQNLEEFTNYSIEVTAVTVGEGPYSTPIIVITDQDGELYANVCAHVTKRGLITPNQKLDKYPDLHQWMKGIS